MNLEQYESRFRANVDAAALEVLLTRVEPEFRTYLLLLCLKDPPPEELKAAAETWIRLEVKSEGSDFTPVHMPGLVAFFGKDPAGLRIRFDDPELQALWLRASGCAA